MWGELLTVAPSISVLVPVFNGQQHIGRCLRSLLSQIGAPTYEILVVDDGSSDLTSYALTQFGRAIVPLKHEENRGLPASLNTALEAARGEYVVRVDADDYVNSHFLAFLFEFLTRNSDLDAAACDYYLVSEAEVELERCDASTDPIGCGILFRKSDVVEIGGYDESFLRHEDKELMIRFLEKKRLGHLAIPLYRYRRHSKNITNDDGLMRAYERKLEKRVSNGQISADV